MFIDILIGCVNILGWGLKPLIEKRAVQHSSVLVFSNTRYIVTAFISIIVLLLCKRKYITDNITKHLNIKTLYYSFIVAVIGLLSIMSNYYLLSKYDASIVVGLVEPSIILVTLLLGYIFFNEKISLKRVIGLIIISIGICVTFISI